MRRVVVTGMGIVSSLGDNQKEVLTRLQKLESGLAYDQVAADHGLRSCVSGNVAKIEPKEVAERKHARFMSVAAAYSAKALQEAVAQSGLTPEAISNPRTGLIFGSGGASNWDIIESTRILAERGIKNVGPFRVPRAMGSTTSACLATLFSIKGPSYSISSACATSAHCIGNAMEQIQLGKQDVMFAGGGEEVHWTMSILFDAMGALSVRYNETPKVASRAFDSERDGFVISGGGGALVLESLEHAQSRGAKILAELVGYAATSDGEDMVAPNGIGAKRCMQLALEQTDKKIDYINAHATSTPIGDAKEFEAIKSLFGKDAPLVSTTKSLSGHALGAAGVHEAIYSLLMMENEFVVANANIVTLDPMFEGFPLVRQNQPTKLNCALSNSFGFGGTNSSLVFARYNA